MLEIKDKSRKLLKSERSAVLSPKKINGLVNRMSIVLNANAKTFLKEIVNLRESAFLYSYFFETFKGETIKIANYNVFEKTIKFAKDFFKDKNKKYVLEITENIQEETILEIYYTKVLVLKIKFSFFLPIEFDLLKNNFSYEELFKYYQNSILYKDCEPNEIREIQSKLENIIKLGHEGVEELEEFFEKYIEYLSIDCKHNSSWYKIKMHTLKNF